MSTISHFRRLIRMARGLLAPLVGSGVASFVTTALDLALLALLARFVDEMVRPGIPGTRIRLLLLALSLVAVRGMLSYLGRIWSARASAVLVERLQNRLFAHAHQLSLDFFDRTRPGDMAARLFHDADAAARLVTQATAAAFETPLRLVGLFGAVWYLDPRLAAGAALVVVPGMLVSRLLVRKVRQACAGAYDALSSLYDRAIESVSAAELVKSLGREREEIAEFAERNRELVTRQLTLERLYALQGPLGQCLHFLALTGILAYGASGLATHRISPGQLAAALVAVHALLGALESLFTWQAEIQGGLAAADRVFAVLDETPSVAPPVIGRPATFESALCFHDVGFAYPGRGPLLVDVSFCLRKGERVALTGPNGSGKTTLLRLALRLLDPTSGRITIDDQDLRDLDLAGLRSLFAVVTQDVVLFDRSIRDNIACGARDVSAAKSAAAAARTGLDAISARLPQGIDTMVGPRGTALSAGERQRVALARAVVRDAPIFLLDEATSALDSANRQEIGDLLTALGRDRTVLLVAHREESLRGADRLLAIDRGRVIDVDPSRG